MDDLLTPEERRHLARLKNAADAFRNAAKELDRIRPLLDKFYDKGWEEGWTRADEVAVEELKEREAAVWRAVGKI